MFEWKVARVLGALAFGSACGALLLASCSTPNFAFVDADASVALPHCQDAQRDDGESDVDCGGACAPCALAQSCNSADDCKDGACTDGTCQIAGCDDGAQNGNETDVDCGGDSCKACASNLSCMAGTDCQSGVCTKHACAAPTCKDGLRNGDESDIDCGGSKCSSCSAGQACSTPSDCLANDCTRGTCTLSCAAGFANCDGDEKNGCETDIRSDADHCGGCEVACSLSNASASCTAGVCTVTRCSPPFDDCNGDPKDGCEANTKTDVSNCGACAAKPCPTLHGTAYCADSACGLTCASSFADCDGMPGNGCEKDIGRDVNNCGGCGKVCTPDPGKTAWCSAGTCGESTCAAGRGDCNGNPNDDPAHDGCETDFLTDGDNCGSCGDTCGIAFGTAQCSNGVCAVKTCSTGLADCTGGYADGCETNLDTDVGNCGACGKACTTAGGSPQCAAGACQIKSCSAPFADCNGSVADGCEIDTSINSAHCGSCSGVGSNCGNYFANAAGHCANSACSFDACGAGYANCDSVFSNGCETSLETDKNHCGACATSCASTNASSTSCNKDSCVPVCAGAYLSCSDPEAGCTTNGATDPANCGGCGKVCSTAAAAHVAKNTCASSTCQPACLALWADCDGIPANGCELTVATDRTNCGGCGVTCGSNAHTTANACNGGACAPSCTAGWAACGSPAQACNVQLGSTANCTACGDACTGAKPYCTPAGCSGHLDISVAGSPNNLAMSFSGSATPILNASHLLRNSQGSNRIVLVGVTASEPYLSTESVEYNGTTMLLAVSAQPTENRSYAGIFYLLDSALPQGGNANYQVSVTFNVNSYAGTGAVDIVEFKNVQQSNPFVTTGTNPNNADCSTQRDRSVTLDQNQAGSWGYAVTGARSGTGAVQNPGFLVQTMNLSPGNPTPSAAVAGYGGPFAGPATFTWNVQNCSSSASVAVALKRSGD